MTYKLFLSLYTEALGNADVDQEISFLANSDLKTVREKYGYSRAAFSRLFNIPIRSLEDWDAERRKMPDYVKALICYALFEGGDDGK